MTVSLQEVYKYSDTEELPENFGQRIGNALSRGWRSFVDGMADFIVALAYNWMWIVLWAAVIIAAAVIVGKIRRRRRRQKICLLRKKRMRNRVTNPAIPDTLKDNGIFPLP